MQTCTCQNPAFMTTNFARLRRQMIEEQLLSRGLKDPIVLEAIGAVPREVFVPSDLIDYAYKDSALPIEVSQTISQPYIVALMTSALELKSTDRVLEVGTGSGYSAAVLGEIAAEVYTIERHQFLADTARERLDRLGYRNIRVKHGDGTLGWLEEAPFDAIVVTAAGPEIPVALKRQLVIGGRLVIPVGGTNAIQKLVLIKRVDNDEFTAEDLGAVRFVPLIGDFD